MKMSTSSAGRPKLGRPPKVTREQIAEAALEIGLERATVRNVAEHLGMSVPGLYHHVGTREELVAMAAAHSLEALRLPEHDGRPWDEWLVEYARFVYDALVAQPELIGQVLAGTNNTLRQAQHLEEVLGVLTAAGFTVADAYEAYAQLMSAVTGAATSETGRAAANDAGHPLLVDLRRAVKALGPDTVPLVHELVRSRRALEPDTFAVVRRVVASLADGRGGLAANPPG